MRPSPLCLPRQLCWLRQWWPRRGTCQQVDRPKHRATANLKVALLRDDDAPARQRGIVSDTGVDPAGTVGPLLFFPERGLCFKVVH